MLSICGKECCGSCSRKDDCGGCIKTDGRPFEETCVALECFRQGGLEAFRKMKETLIEELNALGIRALKVNDLNLLNGSYVNLKYTLPNGQAVQLLEDNRVYLGTQIEIPGSDRCYGVVADERYLLVCEYGCKGTDPEIVAYRRR